ncbi:MAG: alcohol dehydrogenase catalytic domain-containing protein [Hyphomicrobiales bacterium]
MKTDADTMNTMAIGGASGGLEALKREMPVPSSGQIRVRVRACGVCRTDLHLIDGELPDISLPIVSGHEIVGIVEMLCDRVSGFQLGDRVGIPWPLNVPYFAPIRRPVFGEGQGCVRRR